MTNAQTRDEGKGRALPALAFFIVLLCTFPQLVADSSAIKLDKTQEFCVRDFYVSNPHDISGTSTWTPIKSGYLLQTSHRLYFYSHSLTLTNSVRVGELSSSGVMGLVVSDDTLIYVLESGRIDQYDLQGKTLRRWHYPSHRISGHNLAVWKNRIMIAGQRYWFASSDYTYPRFLLYNVSEDSSYVVTCDSFCSDSLLDVFNKGKRASLEIGASTAAFKEGFALVCNMSHEVFLFSHSGQLEGVIDDSPPGYKGLLEAPAFDLQRAIKDTIYSKEWNSSWDCTGGVGYGISILDDSLLVVPRRTVGDPYYIDIYDLKNRRFLERLRSDVPLIGAADGQLFFGDSLSQTFAKISAYRIVSTDKTTETPDSLVKSAGCSVCGKRLSRYEYAECAEGKLNAVDTLPAGNERTARVFSNYVFEPKRLRQFCAMDKKNMFVFISPTGRGGDGVLIDSLSRCLKNNDDWFLTTVVCHPNPEELKLYLLNLPGDQILVNRNVRIPDSTISLSDVPLPPLTLAFTEGGKELISAYSLAPNYDRQKARQGGLTFKEFLAECGLIESEWE